MHCHNYFNLMLALISTIDIDISAETSLPQDCVWRSWVEHGCVAPCGKNSVRTKSRTKTKEASHGGKRCRGASTMITPCELTLCTGFELPGRGVINENRRRSKSLDI